MPTGNENAKKRISVGWRKRPSAGSEQKKLEGTL
jgi:hypothetical protein